MNEMQPFKTSVQISSIDIIKDIELNKENNFTLYKIYLPRYKAILNDLEKFLNTLELIRARKYHIESDKNRFIICRSILKFVLAHHTQSNINNITIELLPNKKPYLPKHPHIFFNISHSGDYAVLAISSSPIGIDIEYIDLNYSFQDVFPSIFNKDEIRFINNSDYKTKAFYTLWTRKEAFVKALGKGIDEDFSKIPSMEGLHFLDASINESSLHWQVHNFEIDDENYLGAIARIGNDIPTSQKLHFVSLPHTIENIMECYFKD